MVVCTTAGIRTAPRSRGPTEAHESPRATSSGRCAGGEKHRFNGSFVWKEKVICNHLPILRCAGQKMGGSFKSLSIILWNDFRNPQFHIALFQAPASIPRDPITCSNASICCTYILHFRFAWTINVVPALLVTPGNLHVGQHGSYQNHW